jgi:DNA polymerase-3 subunit epsilon
MHLNLTHPLAILDLETTGVNVGTDRIIEIAIIKVNPDGTRSDFLERINPGMPIPAASTAIHGITDQDVKDCPQFSAMARDISAFLQDCDLAGFNAIKFDIPLLMEEFLRADIEFSLVDRLIIDVQNIFHKMEPRNLRAAYRFYCGKILESAHSAQADAEATLEVLQAQVERYQGQEYTDNDGNVSFPVSNDMKALHSFSATSNNVDFAGHIVFNENQQEVFNFGKYKGYLVEDIFRKEPSYYDWMMKSQFPLYTKKVIRAIHLRMAEARKSTKE